MNIKNNSADNNRTDLFCNKIKNKGIRLTALFAALVLTCAMLASCSPNSLINGIIIPNAKDDDTSSGSENSQLEFEVDEDTDEPQNVVVNKNDETTTYEQTGNVGDTDLSLPDVAELVKDSVVEIKTKVLVDYYYTQKLEAGAGSGVIFSKDGYIVTNNHVIDGAQTVSVRLNSGKLYEAKIVASDSQSDIAVIKINAETELTAAHLGNSNNVRVGEAVIAIGNPLGTLGGSVTDGIISSLPRAIYMDNGIMTLLQTNAAINPGNSGGALFNMRGELIGIVNAKIAAKEVEGIGFAIPINNAYDIFCDLVEHGYVTGRPDLGLACVEQVSMVGFGSYRVYVYITESRLTKDLVYGDRLVSVNGIEISEISDINYALYRKNIGDEVEVVASRGGEKITVTIKLAEYVPSK